MHASIFTWQSRKHKYCKCIHQYLHDNQESTSTVNAYINTKVFHTQPPTIWSHTDTYTLTVTPTHAHTHTPWHTHTGPCFVLLFIFHTGACNNKLCLSLCLWLRALLVKALKQRPLAAVKQVCVLCTMACVEANSSLIKHRYTYRQRDY